MTIKLAHHVVTFSLPIGEKNVMTGQNIEVADAKGSHPLSRSLIQHAKYICCFGNCKAPFLREEYMGVRHLSRD